MNNAHFFLLENLRVVKKAWALPADSPFQFRRSGQRMMRNRKKEDGTWSELAEAMLAAKSLRPNRRAHRSS
jgi:hypothetical protein